MADPATRQLARRNIRCYWRQSSPATPWQGTRVDSAVTAKPLTVVTPRIGFSPSSGQCRSALQSILYYINHLL